MAQMTERELVRAAVSDQNARELLRQELRKYVKAAVDDLVHERGVSLARTSELVEQGMRAFDRAFNVYLKNGHITKIEEGHFYAYYRWWMRQEIVTHLSQ